MSSPPVTSEAAAAAAATGDGDAQASVSPPPSGLSVTITTAADSSEAAVADASPISPGRSSSLMPAAPRRAGSILISPRNARQMSLTQEPHDSPPQSAALPPQDPQAPQQQQQQQQQVPGGSFNFSSTGSGSTTMNSLASAVPSADKLRQLENAPRSDADESAPRAFDKTLASDLAQDDAVSLLNRLDEKTSLFREFTHSDMSYLAQVLTILKFSPGDTIIESGEESSFVGIVLEGVLQVKFGDVTKPIPEGSLLGELSFFEGGIRTAAVSSQTDSIVAMITFNELELLAEYAPTIRLKLMVLFALEGIKKMRMVSGGSKPAPPTASKEGGAEGSTPYSARPPVNKRGSMAARAVGSNDTSSASTTGSATVSPVMSPSTSAAALPTAPLPTHERTRSMRRASSLHQNCLPTAGMLADKAAPAAGSAAATPGSAVVPGTAVVVVGGSGSTSAESVEAANNRTVEALFRIRMKASERSTQDKISKALEKRKRAEHKAYTSTVIADAQKRELDKKQEFIEELYQENIDLREYKAWAQKKHVNDARIYKEKLDQFAELQAALSVETEKRMATQTANDDLYAQLESMVRARTMSYAEQVSQLESNLARVGPKVEVEVRARQDVEEQLRQAVEARAALEVRVAEEKVAVESEHASTVTQLQDASTSFQRQLAFTQDELATVRRALNQFEEKHHALTALQESTLSSLQHKEMLLNRLHHSLGQAVIRSTHLAADLEHYKTVLKYLLASALVKAVRRRRALQTMYVDQMEMARKVGAELVKQARAKEQGKDNGNGGAKGGEEDINPTSLAGSFACLSSRAGRMFASSAKTDALLVRLSSDLLPSLRQLLDELCQAKDSAQSMAESFFRRTIELKQQVVELETRAGMRTPDTAGQWRARGQGTNGTAGNGSNAEQQSEAKEHSPHFVVTGGHKSTAATRHARPSGATIDGPLVDDDDASTPFSPPLGSGLSSDRHRHRRRISTAVDAHGDHSHPPRDSSPSPTRGVPHSVVDLKDARSKAVYYKKKVKEYKETNAMLSTRNHAFAERLRELEDWQRALFQAGIITPQMPPTTPSLAAEIKQQQQQQQQQLQGVQPLQAQYPRAHWLPPQQAGPQSLSPLPPLAAPSAASLPLALKLQQLPPSAPAQQSPHPHSHPPPPQAQHAHTARSAHPTPMHHRYNSDGQPLAEPLATHTMVFRPHTTAAAQTSGGGGMLFQIRGPPSHTAHSQQSQQQSFLIQPAAATSASPVALQPHPPHPPQSQHVKFAGGPNLATPPPQTAPPSRLIVFSPMQTTAASQRRT